MSLGAFISFHPCSIHLPLSDVTKLAVTVVDNPWTTLDNRDFVHCDGPKIWRHPVEQVKGSFVRKPMNREWGKTRGG